LRGLKESKNAYDALKEVALLKNLTASLFVCGMIVLALIGISGMVIQNPSSFLLGIAGILVVGIIIFLIVRLNTKANPQKKEQRAFVKAAKKSKKRLQKKGGDTQPKSSALGTFSTLKKAAKKKKKTTAHLTVIDGKKGKKKNRASF
jgi:large-conductance mechanosensitive channel